MDSFTLGLLCLGVLLIAFLYSSVGHAGASGYIAVMSLLSMAPESIKPAALALNVLVATIGSWQFWRAGHFRPAVFWPFALPAVPAAWFGGYLVLPAGEFKLLVGAVLLFSAWRFFWHPRELDEVTSPPLVLAVVLGAVIGLLSGLTGTGGGIFLTPLLLVAGWAHAKPAAAVSALFILANSAAGLLGNWQATGHLPGFTPIVAAMAAVGGLAGSYLGSRRLPATAIKRLLAAVLLIAGIKLLSGA